MENKEKNQKENLTWHKPQVQKLTVTIDTAGAIVGNTFVDFASG